MQLLWGYQARVETSRGNALSPITTTRIINGTTHILLRSISNANLLNIGNVRISWHAENVEILLSVLTLGMMVFLFELLSPPPLTTLLVGVTLTLTGWSSIAGGVLPLLSL